MPGPLLVLPFALVALGAWFLNERRKLNRPRPWTKLELAEVLENRAERRGPFGQWESFLDSPCLDPEFEALRQRCRSLEIEFPSQQTHHPYSPEGYQCLRELASRLRETPDA